MGESEAMRKPHDTLRNTSLLEVRIETRCKYRNR